MKEVGFLKLLTYENNKLMIEGYELGELANMYKCSEDIFLDVIAEYLNYYGDRLK